MQLQSTNIADYFEHQTSNHGNQISPCLIFDAKEDLEEQGECEDDEIESITGDGGPVVYMGQ